MQELGRMDSISDRRATRDRISDAEAERCDPTRTRYSCVMVTVSLSKDCNDLNVMHTLLVKTNCLSQK